jgi:hypothetical protein
MNPISSRARPVVLLVIAAAWLAAAPVLAVVPGQELVLVQDATPMRYLANRTDPHLGLSWTLPSFDDRRWSSGVFGVGFEAASGRGTPKAAALLRTRVPRLTFSVFTRTVVTIDDVSGIENFVVGADYDDAFAVWINGTEVFRSPELRAADPGWFEKTAMHESSNGAMPDVLPATDITAAALPALRPGPNLIAIAVWNASPLSDDLVIVPFLSINHPPDIVRGPYLQSGSPTSLVVRWRTNRPSPSEVWLGPASGELIAYAGNEAVTTEHEVEVAGLSPGTSYVYAVGDPLRLHAGNQPDQRFTTAPPFGSPKPARIWVLGDSGTADEAAAAVANVYRFAAGPEETDFWMMLGDNAYPSGTDAEYQAAVFDMYPDFLRTSVLWPTLGNHDGNTADSDSQTGPYYDIFTLPSMGQSGGVASGTEAYYAFDYGNMHIICLESHETDRSPDGPMMQWLKEDLASTTQEWIIAFWHHPPYSKGSHDSDDEIQLIEMRENALPILEEGGVDLVLTGHSHSYERSVLLDGHYGRSGSLMPSMVLDAGNGRPEGTGAYRKPGAGSVPHAGAVYVVAGSSGQVDNGDLDHPVMVVSLARLGSLVLDVEAGRLDATFLAVPGRTPDHFTIVKGDAPAGPARRPLRLPARSKARPSWMLLGADKATHRPAVRGHRAGR